MFAARKPASLQTQLLGNSRRRVEAEYLLPLLASASAECCAVLQCKAEVKVGGEEKRESVRSSSEEKGDQTRRRRKWLELNLDGGFPITATRD